MSTANKERYMILNNLSQKYAEFMQIDSTECNTLLRFLNLFIMQDKN